MPQDERRGPEGVRSGQLLMQLDLTFDPEYPAPVFVRHPRARRYVVSVRDDGGVRVTLPRWGSLREARAFVVEQQGWIDRQRLRLETVRAGIPVVRAQVKREAWAREKPELPPRLLELAAALGL